MVYLITLNENETRTVAILNESVQFEGVFQSSPALNFVTLKDMKLTHAKDSTKAKGWYGLLHVPEHNDFEILAKRITFYGADSPNSDVVNQLEAVIQKKLRAHRLEQLHISGEEFRSVEEKTNIHIATFEGEKTLKDLNHIKGAIGAAFAYLIMMFIIIMWFCYA